MPKRVEGKQKQDFRLVLPKTIFGGEKKKRRKLKIQEWTRKEQQPHLYCSHRQDQCGASGEYFLPRCLELQEQGRNGLAWSKTNAKFTFSHFPKREEALPTDAPASFLKEPALNSLRIHPDVVLVRTVCQGRFASGSLVA